MRIVSLLPSATDILVALGAGDDIVGVSHSCGDQWTVPKLTSTWIDKTASSAEIDQQVQQATQPLYQLDIATLEKLAPDIVVSQSLCEVCAIPSGDVEDAIRTLPNSPILIDLSPQRLDEVPLDFAIVGSYIGREREAKNLQSRWDAIFDRCYLKYQSACPKIAFLDWLDPPFAAGHWVPDMIEWLGAKSALAQPGQPSYQSDWGDIVGSDPDLIIAACCGFEETRASRVATPVQVTILDGYQYFSRPSPMLMQSIAMLDLTIGNWLAAT